MYLQNLNIFFKNFSFVFFTLFLIFFSLNELHSTIPLTELQKIILLGIGKEKVISREVFLEVIKSVSSNPEGFVCGEQAKEQFIKSCSKEILRLLHPDKNPSLSQQNKILLQHAFCVFQNAYQEYKHSLNLTEQYSKCLAKNAIYNQKIVEIKTLIEKINCRKKLLCERINLFLVKIGEFVTHFEIEKMKNNIKQIYFETNYFIGILNTELGFLKQIEGFLNYQIKKEGSQEKFDLTGECRLSIERLKKKIKKHYSMVEQPRIYIYAVILAETGMIRGYREAKGILPENDKDVFLDKI